MVTKSNQTIRLCRNCDEISIWNFNELLKGGEFNYLIYGYDGIGSFDLDLEECNKIYEFIKNEAFSKSENQQGLNILLLQSEVDYLETRYNIVHVLISVLLENNREPEMQERYKDELIGWRFYINKSKPLLPELQKIINQHKASRTKINRKKKELESKSKGNDKELTLLRQKIKLQRILNMQLDLKKISVSEWFEINKEAIEIIENEKPNKRN